MGKDWYQDIIGFRKAAGHYIGNKPHIAPRENEQQAKQ